MGFSSNTCIGSDLPLIQPGHTASSRAGHCQSHAIRLPTLEVILASSESVLCQRQEHRPD